jgi:ABC-type polar amino acid transport system ATPase subunit
MIELRDVRKRFGDLTVLDGVSMKVDSGQVTVLLGTSGSGKSTLLRTINGLEGFDSGEIRVDEIKLGPVPGKERDLALRAIRRRVGMVFQQFHLFPHRSVLENIIEGPVYVLNETRAMAIERAMKLLQQVGLQEKANARPSTLSGGQQQRVAIARALAMHPQAILFDEPTSALDPQMTSEVIRVMTDLAASGQTMIVVTHDMSFARNVAHQVCILSQGQIVESGTPESVFQEPKHDATKLLLSIASR